MLTEAFVLVTKTINGKIGSTNEPAFYSRSLTRCTHCTTAGIQPLLNTPREFLTMLETETARQDKMVKAAGVKAE